MNKEQALELLMLLSALESWSLVDRSKMLPDYLHEAMSNQIDVLKVIVLGDGK